MKNTSVFAHIYKDLPAGLLVSLMALPLCIGIALASNAPIASGILSGAIAGLLVSWLSGSRLSISGPSAGLAVTLAAAAATLGNFEVVLVSIFLCGVMQVLLGVMRIGFLASFFPNSVIKGMLSAVGLIVILKLIPHAIGWDFNFVGDESFRELHNETTLSSLYHSVNRMQLGAVIVTAVAFTALFLHNRLAKRVELLQKIPAPLTAITMGILANEMMRLGLPEIALTSSGHLVNIPADGFFKSLPTPEWGAITNPQVWQIAFVIALSASIESLLSLEASDRLDPERRISNTNRELIAQGIGNMICALVGAIPMTTTILRSSANIHSGAKTRMSGFIHGALLISAVLLVPQLLNHIPLAALASILIYFGYRLLNPAIIKKTFHSGVEQAVPFFTTVVAIVATDLLTGVTIGIVVGLVMVLHMNHSSAITKVVDEKHMLIRFAKDVSFAHKDTLKQMLVQVPQGTKLLIDGTGAHFIDHDILESIADFKQGAPARGIDVKLKNLGSKRLSLRGVKHGELQNPFIGMGHH